MTLGLRAKLTVVIAVLMVLLAGFYVIYLPAKDADAQRDTLRTHATNIALALGASVEPSLTSDRSKLDARLTSMAAESESDIAYILILSRTNTEIAAYADTDVDAKYLDQVRNADKVRPGADRLTAVLVEETSGYLQASAAIVRKSKDVAEVAGTVIVGLSTQSVAAARADSRFGTLLVSLAILVIALIVASLVGRSITTPILAAAKKLDTVSNNLVAAARDQEASSAEEAAAVAQTRRSMETLLDSAQQIADRSGEVLGNAERSTKGSQEIAGRIGNLNELAEKVADILATIMQVADKADLLALNASLEGTRAGEAGKGFALVAAEMRRLAENVIESVSGIRELMKDMRDASQAAVAASEEGNRTSTATTHSAREIALLTQDQRQATEQVIASMDEMGEILNHTLDGIQRTTASAGQLTELAATLSRIVTPSSERTTSRADDADGEMA